MLLYRHVQVRFIACMYEAQVAGIVADEAGHQDDK